MNPILIAGVDLGTTRTCAVIAEVPQVSYTHLPAHEAPAPGGLPGGG